MTTNKHVIVTGAAGGIGTQLVHDLLDRGYNVTAIDALQDRLEVLQQGVSREILPLAANITDSSQVNEAVTTAIQHFGEPYGLLNLAGDNRLKGVEELSDEDWRYLLDVNLTSTFYMCRAVMPTMGSGARVVNTASIFGIRGAANDVGYSAAKAGVVGLTRALATDFGPRNITVNCVAPVVVLTDRVRKMPAEHLEVQRQRIPLGRFSEATDVTRTFLFLLSDDGGFYTGQTFSPNGGDTMP